MTSIEGKLLNLLFTTVGNTDRQLKVRSIEFKNIIYEFLFNKQYNLS